MVVVLLPGLVLIGCLGCLTAWFLGLGLLVVFVLLMFAVLVWVVSFKLVCVVLVVCWWVC